MRTVIPFTGQIDKEEANDWIEAINSNSVTVELKPLESLTTTEQKLSEVAVVANPSAEALASLPKLKWVQSLWAGVENLLTTGIDTELKIVRLTDPQMAESMAEAVLAWCLYLHRKMPQYRLQQSASKWIQLKLNLPQQCNISVFGLGKLGSQAALRLKENKFTVRGWSQSKKSLDGIECFSNDTGLQKILPMTDIAVILLPLTDDTHKLLNKSRLQMLPAGASLINFARGPIIVEADLLECLDNNHIDHAVLDVFAEEPLRQDHRFWSHPKVTVLPHISAPTTITTAANIAANNIDLYFKTGVIPAHVDRAKGY